MVSKSINIAVVMPAYNESSVIGDVLDGIPKRLKIGKKDIQLITIVVNDGSIDDTAEVVTKRKDVYLINHLINSGAGAATRTGLEYAKHLGCDYVITMDSDGQHHSDDVTNIAKEVLKDQADFIIGSRLINTSGMPWYRILGNKGLSFVTFLVFGVFVSDSQSGLKALNMYAVDKTSFRSDQYAFCSEMIWRAHREGLKIKEIPIKAIYTDYSIKKGQSNWGALEIIKQIIKRRALEFIDG